MIINKIFLLIQNLDKLIDLTKLELRLSYNKI